MRSLKHDRPTVGQISSDLLVKEPEERSVQELTSAMMKDYVKNLFECIDREKSNYQGDFYVVVIAKKERLMQNVIRNYFVARASCPTPDYDQAVYKYHAKDEALEYLWVIPDKQMCILMLANAATVDPSDYELLKMVQDFADETLFRKALLLNGELEGQTS